VVARKKMHEHEGAKLVSSQFGRVPSPPVKVLIGFFSFSFFFLLPQFFLNFQATLENPSDVSKGFGGLCLLFIGSEQSSSPSTWTVA